MENNLEELENVTEETGDASAPLKQLMDSIDEALFSPAVEDQTAAEYLEVIENPEVIEDSETVSDGDDIPSSEQYLISEDMLQQLIDANANLEIIIENQERDYITIWEKPLSDYTVLEGIGLITLVMIIGVVIFKIVGGIITCSL